MSFKEKRSILKKDQWGLSGIISGYGLSAKGKEKVTCYGPELFFPVKRACRVLGLSLRDSIVGGKSIRSLESMGESNTK